MPDAASVRASNRALPTIATVLAIYRAAFRHAGYVFRISWLCFIIIGLLNLTFIFVAYEFFVEERAVDTIS